MSDRLHFAGEKKGPEPGDDQHPLHGEWQGTPRSGGIAKSASPADQADNAVPSKPGSTGLERTYYSQYMNSPAGYSQYIKASAGDSQYIKAPAGTQPKDIHAAVVHTEYGRQSQLGDRSSETVDQITRNLFGEGSPLHRLLESDSLIREANQVIKARGLDAAKPLYQKAIALADAVPESDLDSALAQVQASYNALAQKMADLHLSNSHQLDELTKQVREGKDPRASERLKAAMLILQEGERLKELNQVLLKAKAVPVRARMFWGLAQNNSGDQQGAIKTFNDAATRSMDAILPGTIAADMASHGKKFTGDELANEVETSSQKTAEAALHNRSAVKLADANQNKSAAAEFAKCIACADDQPIKGYQRELALLEAQKSKPMDEDQSDGLLANIDDVKTRIELPVRLRWQAALFYLMHHKVVEAKQLLDDSEKSAREDKVPYLLNSTAYQNLRKLQKKMSEGNVEKVADFWRTAGNELFSDLLSGGSAFAVFKAINPEYRAARIASGLLAAGLTRSVVQTLQGKKVGLGDFGRGVADGAMMMIPLGLGELADRRMAAAATTDDLKELVARLSLSGEERNAAIGAGKSFTDALLEKGGSSAERLSLLDGQSGGRGSTAAEAAIRQVLGEQEFLLRGTLAKKPFSWGLTALWNERGDAAYQGARADYLATRGSWVQDINPANMVANPFKATTVKQFMARRFGNAFLWNTATGGLAGALISVPGAVARVGSTDPMTGRRISAGDAAMDIVGGTTIGLMTGGIFGKLAGVLWDEFASSPYAAAVGRFVNPVSRVVEGLPSAAPVFSAGVVDCRQLYANAQRNEMLLQKVRKAEQTPLTDDPSTAPRPAGDGQASIDPSSAPRPAGDGQAPGSDSQGDANHAGTLGGRDSRPAVNIQSTGLPSASDTANPKRSTKADW